MKLLIEISEEVKQAFDCAESNDLKASYYDLGGVIGEAFKNGKPLDTVLDKIKAEIEQVEINGYIRDVECFSAGLNTAVKVINKYKAESEGEG